MREGAHLAALSSEETLQAFYNVNRRGPPLCEKRGLNGDGISSRSPLFTQGESKRHTEEFKIDSDLIHLRTFNFDSPIKQTEHR